MKQVSGNPTRALGKLNESDLVAEVRGNTIDYAEMQRGRKEAQQPPTSVMRHNQAYGIMPNAAVYRYILTSLAFSTLQATLLSAALL